MLFFWLVDKCRFMGTLWSGLLPGPPSLDCSCSTLGLDELLIGHAFGFNHDHRSAANTSLSSALSTFFSLFSWPTPVTLSIPRVYIFSYVYVPLYSYQFEGILMDPNMLQATGDAAGMLITFTVNSNCSFKDTKVTAEQVKAMMWNNSHYSHPAKWKGTSLVLRVSFAVDHKSESVVCSCHGRLRFTPSVAFSSVLSYIKVFPLTMQP